MPLDRQSYEQTYRLIQQLAGPFTEQVRVAARASHNEAEFRSRITRHIEDVATQLGVELTLREEYTLVTGQADAVYKRAVMERWTKQRSCGHPGCGRVSPRPVRLHS